MKRNGVTLLEVLFAIAIAAVGILGVMAVMLVAGKQAADGARFDSANRLGQSAIREFRVRGFNRATGPQGTWASVPVDGQAYCLDPLSVATNGTASPACWFPAFDPTTTPGPRMHRISVRALPGDQSVAPMPPISESFANAIFVCRDDLVFLTPKDHTLPPVQHFGSGTEVRSSTGAFTWIATIESDCYSGGNSTPNIGMVSIVVFHRRDLTTNSERLVNVESINTNEFKLSARPGQPASDLNVREDEWILLCGVLPNGRTTFRWRRVTGTSDVLPAGQQDIDGTTLTVPSRNVSIFGSDWHVQASGTQVALFGAAVTVYERSIRIGE